MQERFSDTYKKGPNNISQYTIVENIDGTNCKIKIDRVKTTELFAAFLDYAPNAKIISYFKSYYKAPVAIDGNVLFPAMDSYCEFVLELSDTTYVYVNADQDCEIICNHRDLEAAEKVAEFVLKHLVSKDEKGNGGINLLVESNSFLQLKKIKLKVPTIDMHKHYNDDFKEFSDRVIDELNQEKSGIILLHGEPGTGKTTFIRFLTSIVNKRFIFLPPAFGSILASPGFIPFLMNHQDSIIVMEDAENVVKERDMEKNHSQISNVLNLTDGMLGDYMMSKIIFTFNCPIEKIDKAITRKGRCLAQYEFGKLAPEKATALALEAGVNKTFTEPIVLANVFN